MSSTAPNFFQVFKLPYKFDLLQDELYKRYIELQQKHHPDRWSKTDHRKYREALDYTMLINQAYAVLKDSAKRAAYMLELKNIDVESEKCQYKPGIELLSMSIELSEEIDNATEDQLINIRSRIESIYARAYQNFEDNFEKEDFYHAIEEYFTMRYMQKALELLESK